MDETRRVHSLLGKPKHDGNGDVTMSKLGKPPSLEAAWRLKNIAMLKQGRGGTYYAQGWPRRRPGAAAKSTENVEAFKLIYKLMKLLPASQIGAAYELGKAQGIAPRDLLFQSFAGTAVIRDADAETHALSASFNPRGSLLSRLNQMARAYWFDCSGSPWLYVETFFEAAPTLVLGFTEFSTVDVVRHRLGTTYRCGVKSLLKDFEEFQPELAWARKTFLFDLAELGSRVAWYFYVAEQLSAFFWAWTTLIEFREKCFAGPNIYGRGIQILNGVGPGITVTVPWSIKSNVGARGFSGGVEQFTGDVLGISFGLSLSNYFGTGPINWSAELIDTANGIVWDSVDSATEPPSATAKPAFKVIELNKVFGLTAKWQVRLTNHGPSTIKLNGDEGVMIWQGNHV